MKEKNYQIENIRAFAIILVVLGHSIILYTGFDFIETSRQVPYIMYLKQLINILEMPLFMSVSGYVFYYSMKRKDSYFHFLLGKAKRLLLPYFFVGTLWVTPLRMAVNIKGWRGNWLENVYNNLILLKSTAHLWYLISLFMIFCLMYWIDKISKSYSVGCEIALLTFFYFISISVKDNVLFSNITSRPLTRAFYYVFWFYLGYLLCEHSNAIFGIVYKKRKIIGVTLVIAFIISWYVRLKKNSETYYYTSALFGTLAAYFLSSSKPSKVTLFLSKNSFGLYLFHSPMIYITFTYFAEANPYLVILLNVFGLGAISIILTNILRKTPLSFIVGEEYARS